ncbi:MAG: hypothetical protein ACI8XM_002080 [Haloarculaceae archaeon]|jgi:hypothetical protein
MPRSRPRARDSGAISESSDAFPDAHRPTDPPDQSGPQQTEDVHVRNYDVRRTYDLVVSVESESGTREFDRRYTLRPGQCRSLVDVLSAGTYDVTVALDPVSQQTRKCAIGPAPDDTALVEVGNGIVSISQGLYR